MASGRPAQTLRQLNDKFLAGFKRFQEIHESDAWGIPAVLLAVQVCRDASGQGGASDGKWVKYRKSPGQGWPRRATNLYLYFMFCAAGGFSMTTPSRKLYTRTEKSSMSLSKDRRAISNEITAGVYGDAIRSPVRFISQCNRAPYALPWWLHRTSRFRIAVKASRDNHALVRSAHPFLKHRSVIFVSQSVMLALGSCQRSG
jgi:hypothetical protein